MTHSEKAIAVANYNRKAALYRRIGIVYVSTGVICVVLVLAIAIWQYVYSHGGPWPSSAEDATGWILLTGAPVVLIGKLIRVFWWPVLEGERIDLDRELSK